MSTEDYINERIQGCLKKINELEMDLYRYKKALRMWESERMELRKAKIKSLTDDART